MTQAPSKRIAPRVLLVEDEESLVLTLVDRLVAEGYRVEARGDGESALALASEEPFDLAILDVMLPGMDGFALCRELRHRGLSLPVLMLTARAQVVDKVVGLKLGADDYLTKPFEMIELLARLEALDMAKKVTHDKAGRMIRRLAPDLGLDLETARRLFSLLFSLRVDTTKLLGAHGHRTAR